MPPLEPDKFRLFADVDLPFECLLERLHHPFLTGHTTDEGHLVFIPARLSSAKAREASELWTPRRMFSIVSPFET